MALEADDKVGEVYTGALAAIDAGEIDLRTGMNNVAGILAVVGPTTKLEPFVFAMHGPRGVVDPAMAPHGYEHILDFGADHAGDVFGRVEHLEPTRPPEYVHMLPRSVRDGLASGALASPVQYGVYMNNEGMTGHVRVPVLLTKLALTAAGVMDTRYAILDAFRGRRSLESRLQVMDPALFGDELIFWAEPGTERYEGAAKILAAIKQELQRR